MAMDDEQLTISPLIPRLNLVENTRSRDCIREEQTDSPRALLLPTPRTPHTPRLTVITNLKDEVEILSPRRDRVLSLPLSESGPPQEASSSEHNCSSQSHDARFWVMNRKINSKEEFESTLEYSLTEKEKIRYLTLNFTNDFTLESDQLNQIINLFPNLCSLSLNDTSVIHSTSTSSLKRAPKLKYLNLSMQDVIELTAPILLQILKGDGETFEKFKELVKQEPVLPVKHYALGWMYENGQTIEGENHDREAFTLYTLAAKENHPGSLYNLAIMYIKSTHVLGEIPQIDRNVKAIELLVEAAKQKLRRAQYVLGSMYEKGQEGITRDYAKAMEWYRQAAEQGHPEAQYALGSMYEEGLGVAVDYAQAMSWYKQATAQDHPNAHLRLGCLWALGRGVPQNDRQAVACFKTAAGLGNRHAAYNLGRMCMVNRGFDEIPPLERDAEAFQWIKKAAKQRLGKAQRKLAEMYEAGQGVAKNELQAFKWYQRAAKQGLKEAQFSLGCMYMQNKGLPKEMSKQEREEAAFNLFTLAAQPGKNAEEKGEMTAQFNLGLMYFQGHGVAASPEKAVIWFRAAAEQGLREAQYFLGCMYESGQGVEGGESPENYSHALSWYTLAAEQGYAEAQYALGYIYAGKFLIDKDLQIKNDIEAVKWLIKAIDQGHDEAFSVLQQMRENGRGGEASPYEMQIIGDYWKQKFVANLFAASRHK